MEEKKHKIFTSADIEKYHKGLLSAKEMHELEKAALEDPFLADALEGYGSVSVDAATDLAELQRRLEQRAGGSRVLAMPPTKNLFNWWRAAAAAVIVGGVGFLTFKLSTSEKHNSIAELNKKKKEEAPVTVITDSNKMSIADSSSIPINSNATATVRERNSTKKAPVRVLRKKIDTTSVSPGLVSTRQSVAPADVNYKQQKKDSVSAMVVHEFAAPVAVEKIESRAARAEGALNDQQAKRVQSKGNNFTGRVVDARKNAIPFANVTNSRDNVGTYADAMGYFNLTSPDSVLNVQVRSVGFENSVMQLKNNVDNQVVLQDDKTAPDKILTFGNAGMNQSRVANVRVEEPEPVDGWTNYNRYMANNINVPEDLKTRHDDGQVQVSFDVNDNGDPVNVKVDKSLCKKCDEEAVRLVKQGPKWKQKNKKAKRAILTIPFRIK